MFGGPVVQTACFCFVDSKVSNYTVWICLYGGVHADTVYSENMFKDTDPEENIVWMVSWCMIIRKMNTLNEMLVKEKEIRGGVLINYTQQP